MKTIGIVAHSAEGGALCFITACREGGLHLEEHMHPTIVMSAIPMGLSMNGWNSGDYTVVGRHLSDGVKQVADAGADFYVCPDNTAHLVLEEIASEQPIPGLHIAQVVGHEISVNGWTKVGVLGTNWTMTGSVYARELQRLGMERLIPGESMRTQLHDAIFDELCKGEFRETTTALFIRAIEELELQGAECVVLGCTEIPLIISSENSPLPVLDSTRLLARYAVREALLKRPVEANGGWISVARKNTIGST